MIGSRKALLRDPSNYEARTRSAHKWGVMGAIAAILIGGRAVRPAATYVCETVANITNNTSLQYEEGIYQLRILDHTEKLHDR